MKLVIVKLISTVCAEQHFLNEKFVFYVYTWPTSVISRLSLNQRAAGATLKHLNPICEFLSSLNVYQVCVFVIVLR